MTAIHRMTDAQIDAALDEAETGYARADTDAEEDRWSARLDVLYMERDARADGFYQEHDDTPSLTVPSYAS